jgi:hypothetical protein
MKYSTVEDVMESLPHPVLPTVQGEPDYQTIHTTRRFLEANSRAIDTHLGGGTLGHLGLIKYDAYYAMIDPATVDIPTLWITPPSPGRAPTATDGPAAQSSAAHHNWEEGVQTYRTCTSVQQALRKQIISVFEPMYLDILNDNMVVYANILASDMLDHLFETYGNITAVDLDINFEHMLRAWDPHQPVETLFKQIQYCAHYSEAGAVIIGRPQQINVGFANIFATGHFMSACRRWNEKPAAEKTWAQFKWHFAATHREHKQIQGESDATAGYHSANETVTHTEDQMAASTIVALENLATATAAGRGMVAALTQANSGLAKQLADNSSELRERKALINQERSDKMGPRRFNPSSSNYCWTHEYKVGSTHTSLTCKLPRPGNKTEATRANNIGGSQANRE